MSGAAGTAPVRDGSALWSGVGAPLLLGVLQLPVAVLAVQYLLESDFARATLVGQLLDAVLTVGAVVHVVLLAVVAVQALGARRSWAAAWYLVVLGTVLAGVLLLALLSAPGPVRDRTVLIVCAAIAALAGVLVLAMTWPAAEQWPGAGARKTAASAAVGLVSIAGLQAWNSLAYAPEALEPGVSTSVELDAQAQADGRLRVTGTVTVKNESDVPTVLVATQYVVFAADVSADRPPTSPYPREQMAPESIIANGAVDRHVIGAGMPFRPFQRVSARTQAHFSFALVTEDTGRAVRIYLRSFSARGDRLFVSSADDRVAQPFERGEEHGAQAVRTLREGSRLRAFVRRPAVVVATWWRADEQAHPTADVVFYEREDKQGSSYELNEEALAEYDVSRQFYEKTVFVSEPEAEPAAAADEGAGASG